MSLRSQPILQATNAFPVVPDDSNDISLNRVEVRTLTLTVKSSTAEDITITLDSVAKTDVAVLDQTAGAISDTADDIAGNDFSAVGNGWTAVSSGDTVIFTSNQSLAVNGTYSLSGASEAVGTFAQTTAARNNPTGDRVVALYITVGGTIRVNMAAGVENVGGHSINYTVDSNSWLPILVSRVHATGTTATGIIAQIGKLSA